MPGVVRLNPDCILYDDDGHPVGVVLDGSVYRLQTETKLAIGHGLATEAKQDTLATEETVSGIETTANSIYTELQQKTEPDDLQKAVLYDGSGLQLAVKDGQFIDDHTQPAFLIAAHEHNTKQIHTAEMVFDELDNIHRIAVTGKVQTVTPPPPVGVSQITVAADDPLEMTGIHDTEYTLTSGLVFHLQQMVVGAEGDPTEKGSKVEVYFDDGEEHIVERIYVTGFTQYGIYPDTNITRSGLPLEGNGTSKLIIRRSRMGASSAQEIDAVLRGFEV